MRVEVFEYLRDYIQYKFPMYYKESNQTEFMAFIDMIESDPEFKKKLDELTKGDNVENTLKSGKLDKSIDLLVDRYAQIKYTDIWSSFDALYNYIRNQIREKADGVDRVSDAIVNGIARDIALRLVQNNDMEVSYYMNGSYNDIFVSNFDAYCERICEECYKKVKDVVSKSEINVSCDKNSYNHLLELTTASIIHDFNNIDIVNGVHDEDIKKRFKFYLKRLMISIRQHVTNVINNMDLLPGVPVEEVINEVTKMVMVTGEVSAQKLLDGKLDGFIESCATKKRMLLDPEEVIKHIYKQILIEDNLCREDDELLDIATKICSVLHDEMGYSYPNIMAGKYDGVIRYLFNLMESKDLSLEGNGESNEIEYKPKKKRVSKSQILLALVAVLVTLGAGSLVYKVGVEIVDSVSEGYSWLINIDARNAVDKFDGFEYSSIYTTVAPDYKSTTDNVLTFYLKVEEAGYDEVYGHIGFYRAYNSVKDDRLWIMDDMLDRVQKQAANDERYGNLDDDIRYNTCYLDYAYDRLEQMGCEEIKDKKYQDAVSAYEYAMWGHSDGEPMKKLSEKDQKLVREIMEMYQKYSKKYEADLGNMLLDQEVLVQYQSQGNGRKS